MKSTTLTVSIIASIAILNTSAFADNESENALDPIVVNADFREAKLSETANAVTVIGEDKLYDKASQSLVEILGSTANVNFTAGASKAKYIQIRGIGERSQFEAPINPSVGFMVDGIDFSNDTLGASLFDVKQIEVLRGPQGTTFGANGMAGVINISSNEPTEETEGHIEATVGNYNTQAIGAAVGGTLIEDKLLGRISVYQNQSDGFMKNSYLNREDTNNIDELAAKLQLRWLATDNHTIDLNVMHTDIDNGYDAFTLDNSRDSHSDNPGKDQQETDAFALKSTYQFNDTMHLISTVAYSKSDTTYSYDEDWSYAGEFDAALWPYNYTDEYKRDKKQIDIDLRLVSDESGKIFNDSTDWTLGLYAKKYDEKLNRNHIKEGVNEASSYTHEAQNKAIYGQLDHAVSNKITLIGGLRVEKWETDYKNSQPINLSNDELLTGGKIGLNYKSDTEDLYYVTVSKGYKPGGVNGSNSLAGIERAYNTETLWNLETGINSNHFDDTLISRLNFFYGEREDQQIKLYAGGAAQGFENYLANASRGDYYGLESQLDYYPNDNLYLFSTVGLLKSTFNYNSNERTPAQSPKYQYNIGFNYGINDALTLKSNIEGKGSYYFSNTHDQKSDAYRLLHSSLEYTTGEWTATLWARNLTDTEYQTRGFFFENNPATGYIKELFTQQGMPRTFGATVSYDF
ncbi:TonB-dependent receptor [bacterium]|nr:TonB-dependent receptor [bacterium]MBU1959206.1 TonB-dependent receptor [bacterium]